MGSLMPWYCGNCDWTGPDEQSALVHGWDAHNDGPSPVRLKMPESTQDKIRRLELEIAQRQIELSYLRGNLVR